MLGETLVSPSDFLNIHVAAEVTRVWIQSGSGGGLRAQSVVCAVSAVTAPRSDARIPVGVLGIDARALQTYERPSC